MPSGLYIPKVMFFGLTNSPVTFQQMMDQLFTPLKLKYLGLLFIYMDNILVTTPDDLALHEQIMHEVLNILERESLFLKLSKCFFNK